jgi:hypothetical protein
VACVTYGASWLPVHRRAKEGERILGELGRSAKEGRPMAGVGHDPEGVMPTINAASTPSRNVTTRAENIGLRLLSMKMKFNFIFN